MPAAFISWRTLLKSEEEIEAGLSPVFSQLLVRLIPIHIIMLQNFLYSYWRAIFTTSLDSIALSKWIGEMTVALNEHVPNTEVDVYGRSPHLLLSECHIAALSIRILILQDSYYTELKCSAK
jgi:hypothetical protein